jgi:hypothetical protein
VISTATTSTVATITSATAVISGTPQTLALFAVLTLIVLLIQKEVLSAAGTSWQRAWSRGLNVALAPLALATAAIVVSNVAQVLS